MLRVEMLVSGVRVPVAEAVGSALLERHRALAAEGRVEVVDQVVQDVPRVTVQLVLGVGMVALLRTESLDEQPLPDPGAGGAEWARWPGRAAEAFVDFDAYR